VFAQPDSLQEHLRVHFWRKPCSCSMCKNFWLYHVPILCRAVHELIIV
jgi:hypothetical protein